MPEDANNVLDSLQRTRQPDGCKSCKGVNTNPLSEVSCQEAQRPLALRVCSLLKILLTEGITVLTVTLGSVTRTRVK